MPDQNQNLKGQAPTPEELFDHCVTLVALSVQSQNASHALRDEVKRALETSDSALRHLRQIADQVAQQGVRLEAMYSPQAMRQASELGTKSVQDFQRTVDGAKERICAMVTTSANSFWLRTGGAAAVGFFMMCLITAIGYWLVPSVAEVNVRRAELHRMNALIEAQSGARLITHDGAKWARIESTPQVLCRNPTKRETCSDYVQIAPN